MMEDDTFALEPDVIESAVIGGLDQLISDWRRDGRLDDQKKWTSDVKTRICMLGRERGFKVAARTSDVAEEHRDYGEWLYDVTWLAYEPNGGPLIDCPLVLETENDQDDQQIWNDWEKLIIANASHRIMMFGKPTDAKVKQTLEKMISDTDGYRQRHPGDRYLLAGFSDASDHFHYKGILVGIGVWPDDDAN